MNISTKNLWAQVFFHQPYLLMRKIEGLKIAHIERKIGRKDVLVVVEQGFEILNEFGRHHHNRRIGFNSNST